jgi:alkaline phosphatase
VSEAPAADRGPREGARRGNGGALRTFLVCLLLVAVAMTLLRLRGYRFVLETPRGDLSQSDPIHFGSRDGETSSPARPRAAATRVRNAILVVADGLGFSHLHAARAQLAGLGGRLELERLPVTGWVTTQSAESLVTDSASAATSLATGIKVPIGVLSLGADGGPLPTIAEAAARAGLAVGLVTDSYLWDATVAAFAAHVASRRSYDEIAAQMARSGFPLLVGERHADVEAAERRLDAFRRQGIRAAGDWGAATDLVASAEPLLVLLPPGSVADPTRTPNAVGLARLALERLAADPDGFLLVFETEEVDSASHDRDLRRVTAAISSLDAAVSALVAFAAERDDTLVLVTSDHETGGLTLVWGEEGEPLGVRWAGGGHTGQPVPLLAYGARAERFSGVLDNTEIPQRLAELLGLDLGAVRAPPLAGDSP